MLTQRVAARFLLAHVQEEVIRGSDRSLYEDSLWEMYRESYAKIGLHLSNKGDLLDYDHWVLFLDDAKPVAFWVGKATPYGIKLGLTGTNGSGEGKSVVKAWLRTGFHHSGSYGEVSHGIEKLTEGSPIVCAVYVPKILKKDVSPSPDGVHYKRSLPGVGVVEKKMIGKPVGIPSGDPMSCPTPDPSLDRKIEATKRTASRFELAEHAAAQLFEDEPTES